MDKNLTKGEMAFRLLLGILVIAVIYAPANLSNWFLLFLGLLLIVPALFRRCYLVKLVDKR